MQIYQKAAEYIKSKTSIVPEIGIICGSGLSNLSSMLKNSISINYSEIPGFPETTIAGHEGVVCIGYLNEIPTICFKGRFHFYEGNDMEIVVLPVRVMALLEVKVLIVTNAAGGLKKEYKVGDIVVIQDHFGSPIIAGFNPLRGHNDEGLGTRFPSISDTYDPTLQRIIVDAAQATGNLDKIHQDGTYCFVSGPSYESRAECRFLHSIGGSTVGMSTVPEIIAARHCGMKVLCLSLVTNIVVMNKDEQQHANHQEVLDAVNKSGVMMISLIIEATRSIEFNDYLKKLTPLKYPFEKMRLLENEKKKKTQTANSNSTSTEISTTLGNNVVTLLGLSALVLGVFVTMRKN